MTLIKIPFKMERPSPPFEGDDIRYPEELVRHFLKKHTKRGDKIFDPFTGLGTTLFVAEELNRNPFGIEADLKRYEWVAGQLTHWQQLAYGDAAKMAGYDLPKMDACMTSPPFMAKHQKWNPLFAGNPKHAGYETYLKYMGRIFKALKGVMKKGAPVIVQVDNLHHGRVYTPLVHDFISVITPSFALEDEVTVLWQNGRKDYPQTNCLIFKN